MNCELNKNLKKEKKLGENKRVMETKEATRSPQLPYSQDKDGEVAYITGLRLII
jgi:hypothetical protein